MYVCLESTDIRTDVEIEIATHRFSTTSTMGKKRRRHEAEKIAMQCNLAGEDGTMGQESMEDCLAELDGLQQSAAADTSWNDEADRLELRRSSSCTTARSIEPRSCALWDPSSLTRRTDSHEAWNKAFQTFAKGGSYMDGLLPNLQVEISRHFHVEKLSSFLLEKCPELRMPAFERWWIDSKWEERRKPQATKIRSASDTDDPVVPSSPNHATAASERLIDEILEAHSMSRNDAESIVRELCRRAIASRKEVSSLSRFSSSNPLRKGDRIELDRSDQPRTSVALSYARPGWSSPYVIRLNETHYTKLKEMFALVHPELVPLELRGCKAIHAFHVLVMALLLRYSSMSGGQLLTDLRGGGMQGAIHSFVFHVLQSTFRSPLLECFASPLNSYLGNFASAFPDLDWHFGSVGAFEDASLTEGCIEANPPFCPGLMTGMVDRIEHMMNTANNATKSVTFVVIVPTSSSGVANVAAAKRFANASFRRLTESCACRLHVVLRAREHGYVEGAQHLRPTRYKESTYDTSIIVLQSDLARTEPLDEPLFENRMRKAFASRHKAEVDERRTP